MKVDRKWEMNSLRDLSSDTGRSITVSLMRLLIILMFGALKTETSYGSMELLYYLCFIFG